MLLRIQGLWRQTEIRKSCKGRQTFNTTPSAFSLAGTSDCDCETQAPPYVLLESFDDHVHTSNQTSPFPNTMSSETIGTLLDPLLMLLFLKCMEFWLRSTSTVSSYHSPI